MIPQIPNFRIASNCISKNLKFTLAFILAITYSFNTFSQDLYVDDDSYLYARDVVLFVNNDIRLETDTSMLYMRGDAQLMQDADIKNSDEGELSVYQNQTVGATEYNFWCSPVGVSVAGTAKANVAFNGSNIHNPDDDADLTNVVSTDYTYTSSYNATANTLSNQWIFTLISAGGYNGWALQLDTGSIATGYGFTMKGSPNTDNVLDFRGRPNNGNFSVACEFTGTDTDPNSGADDHVETLTGNPYPSALDLKEFLKANVSVADGGAGHPTISYINAQIYFWEQQATGSHYITNYQGGYGTYTAGDLTDDMDNGTYVEATFSTYDAQGGSNGDDVGTGADYGPNNERRFAAVGQGFIISSKLNPYNVAMPDGTEASPVGNEAFFTNAMRLYLAEDSTPGGDGSIFAKGGNAKKTGDSEKKEVIAMSHNGIDYQSILNNPTIIPEIKIHTHINNTFYKENLIAFREGTPNNTTYNNSFDALSPAQDLANDAYLISDDKNLVIKSIKYDSNTRLPIGFKANEISTRFSVKVFKLNDVPADVNVYLFDKDNNTYTDIKNGAFEVSLPKGIHNDRFEITFNNQSNLNVETISNDDFKVFENSGISQLEIHNPQLLDIASITLYDVSGKLVTKRIISSNERKHTIDSRRLSTGTYIVEIKLTDQQVLNKKVMISGN
ncbi:T9SS type A sorting domain-containing protein [Algibacter sp. 2305UL17-15]|uniref:T9SS type A sorting domain-containing protein n=1 Tax=Algibacter sp. 2305UL17-15 TaxID=3231268 RepID=UPI00345847C6